MIDPENSCIKQKWLILLSCSFTHRRARYDTSIWLAAASRTLIHLTHFKLVSEEWFFFLGNLAFSYVSFEQFRQYIQISHQVQMEASGFAKNWEHKSLTIWNRKDYWSWKTNGMFWAYISWRPSHLPLAHYMDVEVMDILSSILMVKNCKSIRGISEIKEIHFRISGFRLFSSTYLIDISKLFLFAKLFAETMFLVGWWRVFELRFLNVETLNK